MDLKVTRYYQSRRGGGVVSMENAREQLVSRKRKEYDAYRWKAGAPVFFFQAEDGIRDYKVTGVQTCALPISVIGVVLAANIGSGYAPFRWWAYATFIALAVLAPLSLFKQRSAASTMESRKRSEERRVGKECRSRWSTYH